MTYRQPEGLWSWNDETEACVTRLFIERPAYQQARCRPFTESRRHAIEWYVSAAMDRLGEKADLNMVAAAVADHMHR